MSLDVCFPSPCFNGGTCVTTNVGSRTSFQCLCGASHVGIFCETRQKVTIKSFSSNCTQTFGKCVFKLGVRQLQASVRLVS